MTHLAILPSRKTNSYFCIFPLLLQNLPHFTGQRLQGKWFGQVRHSAFLDPLPGDHIFGIAGDEDYRQIRRNASQFVRKVTAILTGQNDIRQQQSHYGLVLVESADRFRGVSSLQDAVACRLQYFASHLEQEAFILHQQDRSAAPRLVPVGYDRHRVRDYFRRWLRLIHVVVHPSTLMDKQPHLHWERNTRKAREGHGAARVTLMQVVRADLTNNRKVHRNDRLGKNA